jgi:hypothetical protein
VWGVLDLRSAKAHTTVQPRVSLQPAVGFGRWGLSIVVD